MKKKLQSLLILFIPICILGVSGEKVKADVLNTETVLSDTTVISDAALLSDTIDTEQGIIETSDETLSTEQAENCEETAFSDNNAETNVSEVFGDMEVTETIDEASTETDETKSSDTGTEPTETKKYQTVYNGIDYSSVYSYEYYSQNEDVKNAFGSDDTATLYNFVQVGMAAGRQGCESFDVYSYKNAYQDLRLAFRNDLKKYYEHYIRYGKDEGRNNTINVSEVVNPVTTLNGYDYKLVYDYSYYSENNADIKAAFGTDDVATLEHFVTYGMNEQRQGIETFDEKSYRRSYADLRRAFGNNYKSYYLHYINNGSKEKRNKLTGYDEIQDAVTSIGGVNYSLVYDYLYYVAKYTDIKKAFGEDDLAVLKHFINYGMNEQRQGIATFDEKSYRYSYADLRRAFGKDYRSYYLHYMNNGSKEKRDKLTGYDEIQDAVTTIGGVNYSLVYDYLYYVAKYADIKNAFGEDDLAVLNHFVNYGMNEHRQGIESFDVVSYRNAYADLRAAYGRDYAKYYLHYIKYGSNEGRDKTTGVTELQGTIHSLTEKNSEGVETVLFDLSDIYDFNYYYKNNADLREAYGEDDAKFFKHFYIYGLSEGRKGKETYDETRYQELKELVTQAPNSGKTNVVENTLKENTPTFTVSLNDTNASWNISKVTFYVWSKSDQSDLTQYTADKQTFDNYTAIVDIKNNKYAQGKYYIDAYVTDSRTGDSIYQSTYVADVNNLNNYIVADVSADKMSCIITIYNCNVDGNAAKAVKMGTWSAINGQDDLIWYQATNIGENNWQATIIGSSHKSSGDFITHIYADDSYVGLINYTLEIDTTRQAAQARLQAVGGTLSAAYYWSKNIPYVTQTTTQTASWYAAYGFTNSQGNCLTKAATFAWMARELGYTANVIYGVVPSASGGTTPHGWVEIIVNGTTYVCDPDFEYETSRNGYMITYGQSGTWRYNKYYVLE